MAATGQSSVPVVPTTMLDPAPNWSRFDFFRWICTIRGLKWLSTATSRHARSVSGLMDFALIGRSSPNRKKPKNAVHEIVHNAVLSGLADETSDSLILPRRWAVIGSLMHLAVPLSALALLMPACTHFSPVMMSGVHGLGKPREICMLRSADKYDLIVCGERS